MGSDNSIELAQTLMREFADRTGLSSDAAPRRYLWTDAFAVCTFLGLHRRTESRDYLDLAIKLVDQVHHVLGRHRHDDSRSGWISGLSEADGSRHPTYGGLRIGKPLNERVPGQLPDPQLEWDRDGQYYHYLTKWMHALCRVHQQTREPDYLKWAAELAVSAHRAFVYQPASHGPKRMVWKMSIDLSRPLVDSMGQHDPLDGLVTCLGLQASKGLPVQLATDLAVAVSDLGGVCEHGHWTTDDALGIGGLLDDAVRLAQLISAGNTEHRELLVQLLREIGSSLQYLASSHLLDRPAESRLAFRELGLAIGLHGLAWLGRSIPNDDEILAAVHRLLEYKSIAERIDSFWSARIHQPTRVWSDHLDINTVMLATSLAPEGYLELDYVESS